MFNKEQMERMAEQMNVTLYIEATTSGCEVVIDGYPIGIMAGLATLITECADKLGITEDQLINEIRRKNHMMNNPMVDDMISKKSFEFLKYLNEMNEKESI